VVAAARVAAAAPAAVPGIRDYKVDAIPGVIAAGQRWNFIWQEVGNNGDGIVGTDDGGLLLAQNDNSKVVKLDKERQGVGCVLGHAHRRCAVDEREEKRCSWSSGAFTPTCPQMAPQRRILADKYQGEPLDCIGGTINDLTADSKGGVYFTMGGVYYADRG
jgi:hypothetical protein